MQLLHEYSINLSENYSIFTGIDLSNHVMMKMISSLIHIPLIISYAYSFFLIFGESQKIQYLDSITMSLMIHQ